MSNIINDTLKKNGKFDKQALTFFVSFIISIILGIVNSALSYILNMTVNPIAMGIFDSFMILTGISSGINVGNKLVDIYKNSNVDTNIKEETKTETTRTHVGD